MIAFIDDHRGAHGVEPICKVLPIAPSTYHAHVAKRRDPAKLSARARQDAVLKIEVRRVFDQNYRVYGVRKVWRQLKREGFDVARCTVSRLMRDMGLQGVIRGKPVKTTISDKAAPCPLDHVNRQFKAPRPNVLWLSDFTYVATWTGFVPRRIQAVIATPIVFTHDSNSSSASAGVFQPRVFLGRALRAAAMAAAFLAQPHQLPFRRRDVTGPADLALAARSLQQRGAGPRDFERGRRIVKRRGLSMSCHRLS
jgi:hypothetical protein